MRRAWEPEELVAAWTLLDDDRELVANKAGATRLGFCLLLKFLELEARFPRHVGELPKAAVDYVAGQVKVEPGLPADYDWTGRSTERHRSQIRAAPGFLESTRADEDKLIEWLAAEICPMVLTDEGVRAALLVQCRKLRIEPPGRIERIVRSSRARFERSFCEQVTARLPVESVRPQPTSEFHISDLGGLTPAGATPASPSLGPVTSRALPAPPPGWGAVAHVASRPWPEPSRPGHVPAAAPAQGPGRAASGVSTR